MIFDFLRSGGKPEYIVACLGNPGREYEASRHNAGFRAGDYICERLGVKADRLKFQSLTAISDVEGKKILILKPQTFMNNSGVAVSEAAGFYKIPPQNIIVICDDISLSPGNIRVKRKGSDGGQRGLRSIIGCMGSEDIQRIKIGVGDRENRDIDLADWVLGKPSQSDADAISARCPDVFSALCLIISGKTEDAMNLYNKGATL